MLRSALMVAAALGAASVASPAAAQSSSQLVPAWPAAARTSEFFGRATLGRIGGDEPLLPIAQQVQARRWQHVGECVVDHDRAASLSYLSDRRRSDAAEIASARLKPIFAMCLAGAEIDVPASRTLRRAAIADALGISETTR